jgi:hypothetical protein
MQAQNGLGRGAVVSVARASPRLTIRSSGQPPGYRVLPLTSNVRRHKLSPTHLELLKVVLDKGLLAVVLLVLGFVAAKKLERFRSESAYFNKLAERRIQAYDSVLRGLGDSMASLKTILMVAEHGRERAEKGQPYDLDFYAKEVHQQFELLNQQVQKQIANLAFESTYLSEDLVEKVGDLLEGFIEFLNSFFGRAHADGTPDRLEKMQEANTRLDAAWMHLKSQAHEEIYAGTVSVQRRSLRERGRPASGRDNSAA